MIVHVTNIEWDIEDDTHIEELPKEVDLEYDDLCISFLRDMEDSICERLEEIYRYCVRNLTIDT